METPPWEGLGGRVSRMGAGVGKGCLSLAVIEISRHGNHGLGHILPQKLAGGLLHLGQYLSGGGV